MPPKLISGLGQLVYAHIERGILNPSIAIEVTKDAKITLAKGVQSPNSRCVRNVSSFSLYSKYSKIHNNDKDITKIFI